ncbi:MAG: hypothetical protein HYY06_10130 [Deltaproteobacteria bacterium]|nr:hypothetical protein [Deltaproteobacteria bacterium]
MRYLTLLLLIAGCGGRPNQVCPAEKRLADPDGRGERCIDDRSACDAPGDCATDAACCDAECADPDGSGVFECAVACREPECTDVSCPPDMRCQEGADECTAHCVPVDLECPAGWIPADPSGSGAFACVREGSECTAPSDCPADPTGCCATLCADSGDGLFVCSLACDYEIRPDGEGEDWGGCWTDQDCVNGGMGAGSTCVLGQCGAQNYCEPPPRCVTDADCAWAIDTSQCCTCPAVVPRSLLDGSTCWVEEGSAGMDEPDGDQEGAPLPDECLPYCDDVDCAAIACADPSAIECQEGQCVGVYW